MHKVIDPHATARPDGRGELLDPATQKSKQKPILRRWLPRPAFARLIPVLWLICHLGRSLSRLLAREKWRLPGLSWKHTWCVRHGTPELQAE